MSAPNHIAIIMDGNGRWAKSRMLPRHAGHKEGANAVKEVLKACDNNDVKYLTLYAFSSENWQRSEEEIDNLMNLLRYYLDNQLQDIIDKKICLKVIGDRSKLDQDIIEKIENAEDKTKEFTELNLIMAISYGSRQEIIKATKEIASLAKEGKISEDDINEEYIESLLYTKDVPDPDLLIRTGKEKRLSNFLLWQLAYTELLFIDTLWPDIKSEHIEEAISEFKQRERRYGTS